MKKNLYRNKTNVDACKSFGKMRCFIEQYQSFFNSNIEELCSHDCPLECDRVAYKTSLSAADYPSLVYAEALRHNPVIRARFNNRTNVTRDELKANVLFLSIFYTDLSYKNVYEAEKMDIFDLVSNVGGTLGLFLGMSFLSFVEIIDLVVNICLEISKHNPNKIKIQTY